MDRRPSSLDDEALLHLSSYHYRTALAKKRSFTSKNTLNSVCVLPWLAVDRISEPCMRSLSFKMHHSRMYICVHMSIDSQQRGRQIKKK